MVRYRRDKMYIIILIQLLLGGSSIQNLQDDLSSRQLLGGSGGLSK